MYEKGDLRIGDTEDFLVEDGELKEASGDKAIMLPHSCDEWVIGGVEEAEVLIADLKEKIEEYKSLQP